MANQTVLIVDDEVNIRVLLRDYLEHEHYDVLEAGDGRVALELVQQSLEVETHPEYKRIDLVLLDVMLPELDGWGVCKEIRKLTNVPIIMLTARAEEHDEVKGFRLGADDYVAKPIRPSVLMVRIHSILRKKSGISGGGTIHHFPGLVIDAGAHQVTVNEEPVELTAKEFAVLQWFIRNRGLVVSRDQLLLHVWGYSYDGGLRTVDTTINRLRIKLADKGAWIETVRGFGYKFEVQS